MKLAKKVQNWITAKDVDHHFKIDENNQASFLKFEYKINEQTFLGIIETDEQRDAIRAYIYIPFNVVQDKLNEFSILLNRINSVEFFGSVTVANDGTVRWRHIVDFENTEPSIETIDNLFNPGCNIMENWFDEMSAVALTDITAQEIFDKLNSEN
jgi:hypothetical protein